MFKGHEEGLKRAVFPCDRAEYASQFTTALKELALFVEKKGYIAHEMKDVNLSDPTKLPSVAENYDKV